MKPSLKIAFVTIGGLIAFFIGYVSYNSFSGYLGNTDYIEEISNPNSETNLNQNAGTSSGAISDPYTTSTSTTTVTTTLPKQSNNTKVNTKAKITTNMGDIYIELFDTTAPNTVANFKKLAMSGFYNDVKFHRVIEGFMIQTGDPLSKDNSNKDYWGTGGPGYKFADELTGTEFYSEGTIAMANSGPNTNGSQFFIMTSNTPLPPAYTVFGKVTKGQDVADKIEKVERDGRDRPLKDIVISKIEIVK